MSRYKHIFRKGYLPNWTEEIFTIDKRFPTFPVTYALMDLSGDDIKMASFTVTGSRRCSAESPISRVVELPCYMQH
jgi:hypothetical protein